MEPLALPIRARFVPLRGRPDCSPDWYIPRIPGGRFSAVLLAMDDGLVLFVPAAGAGFRIGPRHPIEAATETVTGCVARRRVEDWHGAVVSDPARGSGRCASGGVMPQGFPVSPRRDWIWLSRSCTCRGLVMYLSAPPYGRATGKCPG